MGEQQEIPFRWSRKERGRGEAQGLSDNGAEPRSATKEDEILISTETLMEEVVERKNLQAALKRVTTNKGAPGIDGMTTEALPEYLKTHWPAIRVGLLEGKYTPKPVKKVEIPKPDGGIRMLGIPCCVDRFLQQALLQVLQKRWDKTFSEASYGFRPGRSAHQAVRESQKHIEAGHGWVVDIDL